MRRFTYISAIILGVIHQGSALAVAMVSPPIITSTLEAVGTERCGGPVSKELPYPHALRQAIERCFIYLPYLQDGAKCHLQISQTRQGVVTSLRVVECSGHPKFSEFAERAVLKASPLPSPTSESSFLPVFGIIFSPDIRKFRQSLIANPLPVREILIESSPERPFTSKQEAAYLGNIYWAVERYLTYPPNEAGRQCRVRVNQNQAGEVRNVEILRCESKEFASSVKAAFLKASPLPLPGEAELFKSQLELTLVARPPTEKPHNQAAWGQAIRDRIRSNLVLPPDTQAGIQAVVSVVLSSDGKVHKVAVTSSSGFEPYDRALERAIIESSPLPQPSDPQDFVGNLVITFVPCDPQDPAVIARKNRCTPHAQDGD